MNEQRNGGQNPDPPDHNGHFLLLSNTEVRSPTRGNPGTQCPSANFSLTMSGWRCSHGGCGARGLSGERSATMERSRRSHEARTLGHTSVPTPTPASSPALWGTVTPQRVYNAVRRLNRELMFQKTPRIGTTPRKA